MQPNNATENLKKKNQLKSSKCNCQLYYKIKLTAISCGPYFCKYFQGRSRVANQFAKSSIFANLSKNTYFVKRRDREFLLFAIYNPNISSPIISLEDNRDPTLILKLMFALTLNKETSF